MQTPHKQKVAFLDLKAQFSDIQKEVLQGVQEVCESAEFVLGSETNAFEQAFSAYIFQDPESNSDSASADLEQALIQRIFTQSAESTKCVGVGNGTDALEIAITALELEPKSEIIIPANTYFACAEAVLNAGMKPVIADCEEDGSFCPKDSMVSARTRAILCVHLYGAVQNLSAFEEFATTHNLRLIEDCAQAHGARDELGRMAGSVGDVACFSFYPGKNLGCYGDGGAVLSKHPEIVQKAREIANHGQKFSNLICEKNNHIRLGRNSRLDSIQAKILHIKLESLERHNAHRARCARVYGNELSHLDFLKIPDVFSQSVWHLFVIECCGAASQKRDSLLEFLKEYGIECGVHYPYALSEIPALANHPDVIIHESPNAQSRARRIISLPIGEHLDFSQIEYIAQVMKEFAKTLQPDL